MTIGWLQALRRDIKGVAKREIAHVLGMDAAIQTRGVWIVELSELDSLSHAEVARIKAFMSRTTDRFTCATKPEVAGSGR